MGYQHPGGLEFSLKVAPFFEAKSQYFDSRVIVFYPTLILKP